MLIRSGYFLRMGNDYDECGGNFKSAGKGRDYLRPKDVNDAGTKRGVNRE